MAVEIQKTPPWAYALFAAALVFFLAAASVGWDHTILDEHAFRQTQTAISAYYMVGRPLTLAYETPVLGPPWAVPFEFPLYQWLVAGLVTALGTPLDQTGRFVGVAFFLLSLIPAYSLLGRLQVAREHRLIVLALLLVSPFYAFWSRTFLIESTALCFSLAYLDRSLSFQERLGWQAALGVLIAGSLAALVKITTFATCLLAVALVFLFAVFQRRPYTRRRLGLLIAVQAVPVLTGLAWTRYADTVKGQNPFGRSMTARALAEWNFGTLGQRLAPETWAVVGHHLGLSVGHLAVIFVCVFGLCWARRRWSEAGFCLFLALSGPLAFTNLYVVHEYYAYAVGVFVIATVGLAVVALLERGGVYRRCGSYLLAAVVAVSVLRYVQFYYPKQSFDRTELVEVGRQVGAVTRPDEILVIVGCDWSAELPYVSRRRSAMLPCWKTVSPDNLLAALGHSPEVRVGALVVRERADPRFDAGCLRQALTRFGLDAEPVYADGAFSIYARTQGDVVADARP